MPNASPASSDSNDEGKTHATRVKAPRRCGLLRSGIPAEVRFVQPVVAACLTGLTVEPLREVVPPPGFSDGWKKRLDGRDLKNQGGWAMDRT